MESFKEWWGLSLRKSFLSSCRVCSARWDLEAGHMTEHLLDVPEPGPTWCSPAGPTAEAATGSRDQGTRE